MEEDDPLEVVENVEVAVVVVDEEVAVETEEDHQGDLTSKRF